MAKDYFCVEEIILIHYLAAQEDCLTNRGEKRESSFIVHKYVCNFIGKDAALTFHSKGLLCRKASDIVNGIGFYLFLLSKHCLLIFLKGS